MAVGALESALLERHRDLSLLSCVMSCSNPLSRNKLRPLSHTSPDLGTFQTKILMALFSGPNQEICPQGNTAKDLQNISLRPDF
jgi:hypothetical protein